MTTTTTADTIAREIAETFAEDCQIADDLLREIVAEGREANHSEIVYFAKHLGWDPAQVKKERHRIAAVIRETAVAGSAKDRAAAAKEADTAAKILAAEGPRVAAEIEKMQAKLRGLESDAKLSAKRVKEQNTAVERLRELCPQHIRDTARITRHNLDLGMRREINTARTRINRIDSCLDPKRFENNKVYLQVLRRFCPPAVADRGRGRIIELALSAEWPAIRKDLEKEKRELQAKIGKLQPQVDAALEQITQSLNFYVPG